MDRCRHNKSWLICGARWEWCWACGAIREMNLCEDVNGCYPKTYWVKPQGQNGENPWPMRERKYD